MVKNALLRPPTLVFVKEMLLKKVTTLAARPQPKDTSGGCQKGDVLPSVWGV
jgi:hypothetical protein